MRHQVSGSEGSGLDVSVECGDKRLALRGFDHGIRCDPIGALGECHKENDRQGSREAEFHRDVARPDQPAKVQDSRIESLSEQPSVIASEDFQNRSGQRRNGFTDLEGFPVEGKGFRTFQRKRAS